MKKILAISAVLILVSSSLFASAWTSWEDYQVYKASKTEASEASDAGDTVTAVAKYIEAAGLAEKSATAEIQGWQLNNAGYALIKKFKELTGYQEKITQLSAMEPSKEKIAYQQEIAGLFDLQISLLEEANGILAKGKALFVEEEKAEETAATEGETTEEEKPASGPVEKIQSNIEFVEWVTGFTKDNIKE